MSDKPFSPSCDRNRESILEVLRTHFADRRRVLEIGSGTGQHAVYFARAMPWLTWQCSDVADSLPGIRMWLDEAALPNTPAPIELDVAHGPLLPPPLAPQGDFLRGAGEDWGGGDAMETFDAVFSANTLHIISWQAVEALFAGLDVVWGENSGASSALQKAGVLVIYGPFNIGGEYTSDSNREFDGWLKVRDTKSGIRDLEAVDALAQHIGLRMIDNIAMPANNRCLVWRRG